MSALWPSKGKVFSVPGRSWQRAREAYPAPVGADAALVGDAALVVVEAAFGHCQRPFHGLDDLDQADRLGGPRQAVAAVGAAETFHKAGLGQRLEHLAHRGRLQSRALGQLRRAEHGVRPCGKHGQHHGGVVGHAGDAEHGESSNQDRNCTLCRPAAQTPGRAGVQGRAVLGDGCHLQLLMRPTAAGPVRCAESRSCTSTPASKENRHVRQYRRRPPPAAASLPWSTCSSPGAACSCSGAWRARWARCSGRCSDSRSPCSGAADGDCLPAERCACPRLAEWAPIRIRAPGCRQWRDHPDRPDPDVEEQEDRKDQEDREDEEAEEDRGAALFHPRQRDLRNRGHRQGRARDPLQGRAAHP